jgi:hypothetical protein
MTPDGLTFVPVLNACASLRALEDGRLVHEQVIQSGCVSDVFVGNSLVDMYSKCGKIMLDFFFIRGVSWILSYVKI